MTLLVSPDVSPQVLGLQNHESLRSLVVCDIPPFVAVRRSPAQRARYRHRRRTYHQGYCDGLRCVPPGLGEVVLQATEVIEDIVPIVDAIKVPLVPGSYRMKRYSFQRTLTDSCKCLDDIDCASTCFPNSVGDASSVTDVTATPMLQLVLDQLYESWEEIFDGSTLAGMCRRHKGSGPPDGFPEGLASLRSACLYSKMTQDYIMLLAEADNVPVKRAFDTFMNHHWSPWLAENMARCMQ